MSSEELRKELAGKLESTVKRLNEVLRGERIKEIEPVILRIGRGGKLPHWYDQLKKEGTLPNLDGKTIGSVVEMLLVGVLETYTFSARKIKLSVNPARGTDLPDLELGVKSPSTNYCTSEPFFSPYERLIGSKYDAIILLTDYQKQKKHPPLKLQILNYKYLKKTEIADKRLCEIGLANRLFLIDRNETWARKVFRFLAFVNQSDWRAKQLLRIAESLTNADQIRAKVQSATLEFAILNKKLTAKNKSVIPDTDLLALRQILNTRPIELGVIDALETWVDEKLQEAARMPGSDEWQLLKEGPLNGKIGMSFALQWRFNFGQVFNAKANERVMPLEEFT